MKTDKFERVYLQVRITHQQGLTAKQVEKICRRVEKATKGRSKSMEVDAECISQIL